MFLTTNGSLAAIGKPETWNSCNINLLRRILYGFKQMDEEHINTNPIQASNLPNSELLLPILEPSFAYDIISVVDCTVQEQKNIDFHSFHFYLMTNITFQKFDQLASQSDAPIACINVTHTKDPVNNITMDKSVAILHIIYMNTYITGSSFLPAVFHLLNVAYCHSHIHTITC